MTRRSAVIACLIAFAGKAFSVQKPQKYSWLRLDTFTFGSLQVDLDSTGKKGIPKLVVRKEGKEIVLTSDEIWEALQPPDIKNCEVRLCW
jgi:hypothetical protein